jgi:hypothetical protein
MEMAAEKENASVKIKLLHYITEDEQAETEGKNETPLTMWNDVHRHQRDSSDRPSSPFFWV